MIRYGGGERDNFTLFGFRPDVIDKDVQSPLMNGSAFFIFCSKVVRLTTMMVDPFDALAPAIRGWESISAISPKMPPWLAEDAALADPSQDRFDPVDDLENLHLTGLDDIG